MSLFADMRERGVWRGYERHVLRLNPVLERMSARGMPIDPEAFDNVVATLESDYKRSKAEMQRLVPDDVKPHKDYKREPKNYAGVVLMPDGRYRRYLTWSPSAQGLTAYMRHRGHPVPKHQKTGADTTNKLEITRLAKATRDPLYAEVVAYRKAQTVLKDHVVNWTPGLDYRVHTTFYFDPATGQLSSRRPNVQNAPKHDDPETGGYGKLFRSMVKARPDYTIIEFDYKSFHIQTAAFEAQDPVMLRMGRLDIHSFITACFLKLAAPREMMALADAELLVFLNKVKREHKHLRDTQCKRAILGYINGLGYRKLYNQNREYFNTQNDARKLMDLLDVLFPQSKSYRERIVQKAHDQGYLVSRHGYVRYFWEVNRWQGGKWTHGDDYEAALSFFTQNDAHGELKDRLLVIAERGLDERYGMLNCIHDSIIFECPNELVLECRNTIKAIMEAPSEVLIDPVVAPQGLSVEVDIQGGPDWAHMKGM